MPAPLTVHVVEHGQDFECQLPARLELGRQAALPGGNELEPGPLNITTRPDGSRRLVVGWNSEPDVARQQAGLEPLADGRVRVANLSPNRTLTVSDLRAPLPPLTSAVVMPPFTISLGRRTVHVAAPAAAAGPRTLMHKTLAPGAPTLLALGQPPLADDGGFDVMLDWLQAAAGVLQSAVATPDFLDRAAEALVAIVGLHSGRVLLREGAGWRAVATHRAAVTGEPGELNDTVLRQLIENRCAIWLWPEPEGLASESPRPLNAVVAAPLLNPTGEVAGALYGEVRRDETAGPRSRDKVRAMLVEILADAVAAGLARQKFERERALLGQFFPADLAERLIREPGLIAEPREAEVTVLFADVRGFSTHSERLGPRETFAWISRVLGRLSDCVLAERGVLVDYIGDELLAMWGAPETQPDHAERATRAALAMRGILADLDRESRERWGVPTALGIGLNSGPAAVGDIGSSHKRKYGPLGDTVNVASRTQGITKYLKSTLLASGDTRGACPGAAAARRVARVRVAGTAQGRDLYELAAPAEGVAEFFAASDKALTALEERRFAEAAEAAAALLRAHPGDGPLRLILDRASQALGNDGAGFDAVWVPPGK